MLLKIIKKIFNKFKTDIKIFNKEKKQFFKIYKQLNQFKVKLK